jgi:site-specific DNA-methyltransferase (adenine-specific)
VRRFIALYSEPGDLVVDPFAGHGTTLRVALAMGRRAIGYEIDQRHASMADRLIHTALAAERRAVV